MTKTGDALPSQIGSKRMHNVPGGVVHDPQAKGSSRFASIKCERRAIRNSALGKARRRISLLETKIFWTWRSWIRSNARSSHEWPYPAKSHTSKSYYPYPNRKPQSSGFRVLLKQQCSNNCLLGWFRRKGAVGVSKRSSIAWCSQFCISLDRQFTYATNSNLY
jgi:hypothetical protein